MRKQTLFPVLMILSAISGMTQSSSAYKGTWEGTLKVGQEIHVIFNILENNDHSLTSTTDSPDQSIFGFKCDTTFISGDSIKIEIKGFRASFAAKLTSDSTMSGIVTQGLSMPIVLKRKSTVVKDKYPQTPKPPFPYKSEDVEYDNTDKSLHYGATITIPEGKGPFPAAVLITGSGGQDRDETILGHKVFAVLADALTRNGIVVLRVDDRGMGKSTGDIASSTSEDFAKDVNTSFDYLLSRPEVNKKKAGLIGHSEGGMIAPMVATQRSDVNYIVLLAGPGIRSSELMMEQNKAILSSSGISQPAVDAYMLYYRKIMDIVNSSADSLAIIKSIANASKQWADTTDAALQKEFYSSDTQREQQTLLLAQILATKWFGYFLRFDPQPNLEKLRCKVLAINGNKDVQIIAGSNLAGIEKSLKKSKTKTYTVKELPGLNHLFQTCNKCTYTEYGELEETFSPVALKEINDWLNKYVK